MPLSRKDIEIRKFEFLAWKTQLLKFYHKYKLKKKIVKKILNFIKYEKVFFKNLPMQLDGLNAAFYKCTKIKYFLEIKTMRQAL